MSYPQSYPQIFDSPVDKKSLKNKEKVKFSTGKHLINYRGVLVLITL